MKKLLTIILSALMLMTVCSCGEQKANEPTPTPTINSTPTPTPEEVKPLEELTATKIGFTIEMTDGSVMKGELYPDLAPITVANFVSLCQEDFYAGLIFHRVIPGFMIQGGGYDEALTEKAAAEIKGEFTENGVRNDLKHTRGVISMARTMVPDSASSQFFIMHEESTSLDGNYAAFGKITEGLEVIDKIATTQTQVVNAMFENIPVEAQVIKTITIDQ